MAKQVKARSDLGLNTIMDPVLVPDGFSRVCDGLDLRSGTARTWQLPSIHRELTTPTTTFIWEYRGKWYESSKIRSYHGEYLQGREVIYFTEEGPDHVIPQKIVDGVQADLGTARPLAPPSVSYVSMRYPVVVTVVASGSGSVPVPSASYRIAALKDGSVIGVSSPYAVTIAAPTAVVLNWRPVTGATGYAIFGRTGGSERLLIKVGNIATWTDDGSIQESSETASSHDTKMSFQYVYTYYRKVGTVEDESGPSPVSPVTTAGSTPIITRQTLYDGFLNLGGTSYPVATYPITATSIASPSHFVTYYAEDVPHNSTMFITSTAHGMATGWTGRLMFSEFQDIDYTVTVPTALAIPGVILDTVTPYPAGGTVSVGAHVYKFTASRGKVPFPGSASPAQTTEVTVNATVVGAPCSVRFALTSFSGGTDLIYVYRDGSHIASFDPSTLATWTDTGYAVVGVATIPATNETATRCFSINSAIAPDTTGFYSGTNFQPSRCDIVLTGATTFVPGVGDLVQITGMVNLSVLNGVWKTLAYDSGTKKATIQAFLPLAKSGVSDSGAGSVYWTASNGSYAGWRIYRVGDTSEFLRVADLPLDTLSYTDLVSTDDLGVAIPTAYTANGLEVVYGKAPAGLKRMVSHYGMRFGIVDDLVRWTPAGLPDAWPDVFYYAPPSKPVALVSFRTILAVLCEDGLYGLIGNTPATMSPAGPFSNLGCIAPFTPYASNFGLLWLSRAGIAISRDGVSAGLLAADKVPGRFFYAPSTPGIASGVPVGYGWYLTATQSVQFAESMRLESVDKSMYPLTQVAYDLPAGAEMIDIRSFYWDDRYTLYYVGQGEHARSGCVSVDMSRQEMPITTLPIKPRCVHVSAGGECFMLLEPRALTTVTITSPV